jgi:hypothetical protein
VAASGGLSRCKSCGESFTGWRCPGCGRPLPALGCLTALLPTVFVVTAVGLAVPDQDAPAVNPLPDGSVEYVFQSLREVVLVPVGAASFVVFLAISAVLFRPRARREPAASPEGGSGAASPVGRRLAWFLGSAVLLTLSTCLLVATAITPLTTFRRAVVRAEEVELHGLLRSWNLPRSGIARVELHQERRGGGADQTCDLEVRVTDAAGVVHRSVGRHLRSADPNLTRWRDLMRRFVEQLEAKSGPRSEAIVRAAAPTCAPGRVPWAPWAGDRAPRTCPGSWAPGAPQGGRRRRS